MAESYNTKTGCVYVVELDGYFTEEEAKKNIVLLFECGFRAHKTEV